MSRFDFKGDIKTVGQPQLDFLGKVLENKGFKGPQVLIEPVGEAGDNYVANVKRVVIKENGTTFNMIAKLAPAVSILREIGNIAMLFKNEHVIYTELLPKFRELQKKAGVPKEEWFRFAECYGSYRDVPYEVILLEDLKENNFVMLDRFKALSNDCVKIVLKNLAIYHSLSYVMNYQEPAIYADIKSKIRDILLEDIGNQFQLYMTRIEEQALSILKDDKYKKFITGSTSEILNYATKIKKENINSKYLAIQQGDGWTNNILFQMEGKTPKSCILIDYQLARESSPAFDIMYTLFNSTNYEQRQSHYPEFIDYYHSELDRSLKYYGLDISSVYPRDQLDTDLKRYAKFMLATSVMVSTFVIRKTEDASKFKEVIENTKIKDAFQAVDSMLIQDQDTSLLFKKKLEELVDSFLEFGLLQDYDNIIGG